MSGPATQAGAAANGKLRRHERESGRPPTESLVASRALQSLARLEHGRCGREAGLCQAGGAQGDPAQDDQLGEDQGGLALRRLPDGGGGEVPQRVQVQTAR